MRVLVCGGREFDSWALILKTLNPIYRDCTDQIDLTIIQGGAKGADFLAKVWAKWNGIPCIEYPANWNAHGKRAGYIRNKQMLDEGKPDLVVAFPGGEGTENMVRLATEAGVSVKRISD